MNTIENLEQRILMIATSLVGNVVYVATGGTNDIVSGNISPGGTLSLFVTVGGVADPAYVLDKFQYTNVVSFNISTAGGNDTITLQNIAKPSYIGSSGGNDTVTGGAGVDTIEAGDGNDSVDGGDGNDLIDGGALADTLIGGNGNDSLNYGGRGTAVTADLDNAVVGDDGAPGENDKTSSFESLLGGAGADSLTGDALGNYISGGGGADTIKGGAGNDIVVGGAGQDSLLGEGDNDSIFALDGEIDYIDGGPGTDSCQSDPSESAPPPADPVGGDGAAASPAINNVEIALPASAPPASVPATTIGPVAPFSSKRIDKRRPRSRFRRLFPSIAPAAGTAAKALSSGPTTNLKGDPKNLEFDGDGKVDQDPNGLPEIDPQAIQILGQKLDPYAFGQVNTTRNYHGVVTVNGTPGNDVFVVETTPGVPGVRITNNGGETVYQLISDPININGGGGQDTVVIAGGGANNSTVNYAPAGQPGAPTQFVSDGHTINVFGSAGGQGGSSVGFSNVANVNYVTPFAQDFVHVTNLGNTATGGVGPQFQVDATSDGQPLPRVFLEGVQLLTLNTGQNDNAAGAADQVVFDGAGPNPATVALSLGTFGQDSVQVNAGAVHVVNNPAPIGNPPTANVFVSAGAKLHLSAPVTRLLSLGIAGDAVIVPGGDRVLIANELNLDPNTGRLDLKDNSFILDHLPGGSPQIHDYVANAYQPAAPTHWGGNGITSSFAANDPARAVGYAESFQLLGPNGGTFRGVPVDGSATLVTYTFDGDANLDRAVNFPDLVAVAQHYDQSNGANWLVGDFNFDNTINFPDLVVVAQNYDKVFT